VGLQDHRPLYHLFPRQRAIWCGTKIGLKRSRARIAGPKRQNRHGNGTSVLMLVPFVLY
jgi:hypothetical protein